MLTTNLEQDYRRVVKFVADYQSFQRRHFFVTISNPVQIFCAWKRLILGKPLWCRRDARTRMMDRFFFERIYSAAERQNQYYGVLLAEDRLHELSALLVARYPRIPYERLCKLHLLSESNRSRSDLRIGRTAFAVLFSTFSLAVSGIPKPIAERLSSSSVHYQLAAFFLLVLGIFAILLFNVIAKAADRLFHPDPAILKKVGDVLQYTSMSRSARRALAH